jgi:hypothetical protein
MGYMENNKIGEAYAFFDCYASKDEIARELPNIREVSQIPGELELSLREVKELVQDKNTDSKLLDFIKGNSIYSTYSSKNIEEARKTAKPIPLKNLKYALKANCASRTNEQVAQQLGDVLNGINYTYFKEGETFTGAIIGQVDGEYGIWQD